MHRVILLLPLLMVGSLLHAQTAQWCKAVLPVTVEPDVESAGPRDVVAKLTKRSFAVRMGDMRIEPDLVAPSQPVSTRVVLLFDTSSSMGRKWGVAQSLAINLVRHLDPKDDLSLITYSTSVTVQAGSTKDREAIIRALAELKPPNGRTALLDAVGKSISEVPLHRGDTLVIITDGQDNSSRMSQKRLRDIVLSSGIRIFGIGLYDDQLLTPEEANSPMLMMDLAEMTGGESADVRLSELHFTGKPPQADKKSAERLTLDLVRLANAIDHPIMLLLEWPVATTAVLPLKVEVVDGKGHRQKNLVVHSPRQVAGCPGVAPYASVTPANPN